MSAHFKATALLARGFLCQNRRKPKGPVLENTYCKAYATRNDMAGFVAPDFLRQSGNSCFVFGMVWRGGAYPQGWPHGFAHVFNHHAHPQCVKTLRVVPKVRKGTKTMHMATQRPSAHTAHPTETSIMAAFSQAMQATDLVPPAYLVPDGKVHRFDPDGRGNGRNGSAWYALHLDGVPAGIFGDWRAGFTQTWCSKATSEMTRAEQDEWRATIRAMQAQRHAETLQRQQDAAGLALRHWQAATPARVGFVAQRPRKQVTLGHE